MFHFLVIEVGSTSFCNIIGCHATPATNNTQNTVGYMLEAWILLFVSSIFYEEEEGEAS